MFPDLNIDLVRAFVAVVESGSFTKALADNKIDLAFFSRGSRTKGSFIRFEPMVWAGTEEAQAWLSQMQWASWPVTGI
jgi:hypothetical protein